MPLRLCSCWHEAQVYWHSPGPVCTLAGKKAQEQAQHLVAWSAPLKGTVPFLPECGSHAGTQVQPGGRGSLSMASDLGSWAVLLNSETTSKVWVLVSGGVIEGKTFKPVDGWAVLNRHGP